MRCWWVKPAQLYSAAAMMGRPNEPAGLACGGWLGAREPAARSSAAPLCRHEAVTSASPVLSAAGLPCHPVPHASATAEGEEARRRMRALTDQGWTGMTKSLDSPSTVVLVGKTCNGSNSRGSRLGHDRGQLAFH